MYKFSKPNKTGISRNTQYTGETIEKKVRRILNNKEPIKDGAPLIYTERKDGVNPDYNIRSDRWEYAVEAADKVSKSHRAKRSSPEIGKEAKENMAKEQPKTPKLGNEQQS